MGVTNCLRCSRPYERQRANAHFCPTCTQARKNEADSRLKAERREAARSAIDTLPPRHLEWVPELAGERLEEIGLALENGDPSLLIDGVLEGANTPAGPDEGRSTFFTDLAGYLDELCSVAADDPWWGRHPHAFFEVHDPVKAAVYDLGAERVCGTYAGYMRHYRAKEMACPACADANAERSREKRAA